MGKDPEEELGAMPFSGFLMVRDSMLEYPSAKFTEGKETQQPQHGTEVHGASFGG